MEKKQQKVWSVSWCVQVPEETGPKTLEILNVVFLIEILSTEKKDAIKMRNGLKLCYFDHSWTGWFQWTFFFGKVWMEMFSVPKPARTSWPCLSSITLLLFFSLLLSLYVSSQRYCSVWGWGSLPEGGQAIGATACLTKDQNDNLTFQQATHLSLPNQTADSWLAQKKQLSVSLLTRKFTTASVSKCECDLSPRPRWLWRRDVLTTLAYESFVCLLTLICKFIFTLCCLFCICLGASIWEGHKTNDYNHVCT